ncbi:42233_t:CDS:2, partial [Gigaspora margarita]
YIESLSPNKKEKALIDQEKPQRIKEVLNSMDTTQYTPAFRYWVKIELPVLAIENMYDEFCKIHGTITQHSGQKETCNQVSSKCGYCRQDLVEKFVTQCTVCTSRLTRIQPLAGYQLLSDNSSVEVAASLFEIFTTFGQPLILQLLMGNQRHPASQGLAERANGIIEMKLEKWMGDNKRRDWSFGLRFIIYAMNNSICRAHKISNEFGLENIQESVNDLDDLIENTNSISITTTESSSLNQDSNIETQSNLVNDNHENQDTALQDLTNQPLTGH